MATFVFNGTTNVVATGFDVDEDQVVFDLDVAEVASVTDSPSGAVVTSVSGATLTFPGLSLAALAGFTALPAGFLQIGTAAGDELTANGDGSAVVALAGNDVVVGSQNPDLIFGNAGNDTLIGNGGSDRLYGGQGNDILTLTGLGGDATEDAEDVRALAVGGLGEDVISVGGETPAPDEAGPVSGAFLGAVTVFGGNEAGDPTDGADQIDVTLGADSTAIIYGNGGNDGIVVEATDDSASFTVYGGMGNDTIEGSVGTGSLIYAGLGADLVEIDAVDSVTVYGGNGSGDASDGSDGIEVFLSVSDDNEDADLSAVIYGNGGNDVIQFGAEGAAEVSIFGGQGIDVIGAGNVGSGSAIYGGLGTDAIQAQVVGAGVEIYGGNGVSDTGDGTDAISVQLASSGTTVASATIFGNGGDDLIQIGGTGNASAFGGAGGDIFLVEANGSALSGGLFGDVALTGGLGSDTYAILGSGQSSGGEDDQASGVVRITDFDFDQDFIVSSADSIVRVSGTVNEFSDLVALAEANDGIGDGTDAVLITVATGSFAGSYLAYTNDGDSQIVEITGFRGTVDADVFTSSVIGGF